MTKSPLDLYISRKLRINRIFSGISQAELGNLTGVTSQQIQKYENGINRIHASRLYEISQILNISIADFFEDYIDDQYYNFEYYNILQDPKERESNDLIKYFNKIENSQIRRDLIKLICSIAQSQLKENIQD